MDANPYVGRLSIDIVQVFSYIEFWSVNLINQYILGTYIRTAYLVFDNDEHTYVLQLHMDRPLLSSSNDAPNSTPKLIIDRSSVAIGNIMIIDELGSVNTWNLLQTVDMLYDVCWLDWLLVDVKQLWE